jgi:hypothetical protein
MYISISLWTTSSLKGIWNFSDHSAWSGFWKQEAGRMEDMMIFDAFTISGAFVVIVAAVVLFYVVRSTP